MSKQDTVKCYVLSDEEFLQHGAEFTDRYFGACQVDGWITEDGCAVFTENRPRFHPMNGKKLKHCARPKSFDSVEEE
jgi:hypothetical protein